MHGWSASTFSLLPYISSNITHTRARKTKAHRNTRARTQKHTRILPHTRTFIHTEACTHTRANSHTDIHGYTSVRTCTQTHERTHRLSLVLSAYAKPKTTLTDFTLYGFVDNLLPSLSSCSKQFHFCISLPSCLSIDRSRYSFIIRWEFK